jgi:hypothetical protein
MTGQMPKSLFTHTHTHTAEAIKFIYYFHLTARLPRIPARTLFDEFVFI